MTENSQEELDAEEIVSQGGEGNQVCAGFQVKVRMVNIFSYDLLI